MSTAKKTAKTVVEVDETPKSAPPAFILGKRPETVPGNVRLELPDGTEAAIPVEFVYRTRKEFGEFWDKAMAAAGEAPKDEKFSFERLMGRTDESDARRTLEFVRSWGLDDVELNQANLEQLFDEVAGAASAFWEAYRAAMVEGRRGN